MTDLARLANQPVMLTLEQLLAERWPVPVSSGLRARTPGLQDGPFRSAWRGRGLDFDDLRPYQPGDDLRHVDWKVSARTGRLHSRLYHEERDQRLSLGVDLRASMFTGSGELLAVRACRLAAHWLWQATDAGFHCGVAVLDDAGLHVRAARRGRTGALAGCQLLAERFTAARALVDILAGNSSNRQARHEPGVTVAPPSLQPLLQYWQDKPRLHGIALLLAHLPGQDTRLDASVASTARALPVLVINAEDAIEHRVLPARHYRVNLQGRHHAMELDPAAAADVHARVNALRNRRTRWLEQSGIAHASLHTPREELHRWLREHRVLP